MKKHAFIVLRICAAGVLLSAGGCGLITDKDRWPVAKVDGEIITRGELFGIIYDMHDAERPVIRTRYDLRRVLEQIIDERIKGPLGERLAAEGKIQIPREAAREQYFLQTGDRQEELRMIWSIDLSAGESVPDLLGSYGMTAESVQIQQDFIEQETDLLFERLLGDQAIQYMALQEFQAGRLEVDPEALRREYEVRKPSLRRFESLEFLAIRLPDIPGARSEATQIQKRIDSGESFDTVFNEYMDKGGQFVMQSTIDNNPGIIRFKSFWGRMSGAETGEIHGPVYLPPSQIDQQGPDGQTMSQVVPAHWLVLQVTNHTPEATLTFEEAAPELMPPLLVAEMMVRLWKEHGVEIYEDKLPDPAGFKGEYGESILDL